jgi:regulator of protease activity HflC (stomatin/prohibitin superfamily)
MEQTVTTHYTPEGTRTKRGGYVITGDQNVAVLSASVKYTVSDPVEYALNVDKVDKIVNGCVSSALLTEAAAMDVDILLTSGLDEFAASSLKRANEKVEKAHIGITINTLELTEASMAAEVRTIYEKGTSALVEAETIKENARLYEQNLIPQAQASKQTQITAAQNEKEARVSAATAALAEFWGVLEEYERNPEAVMARLLAQKTQAIVGKIGTIRIVQDGESTILLIPKVEGEDDGES